MRKFRGFILGRRLAGLWRWRWRPRQKKKKLFWLGSRSGARRRQLSRLGRWIAGLLRGGGGGGYHRPLLLEEAAVEPPPPPPPKGQLAVYVKGEGEGEGWGPPQRYLVPVLYFNHPLFAELLREAESQFGFHHPGGITIPCPAWRFERVRTRIAASCDGGPAARKGGRMCGC